MYRDQPEPTGPLHAVAEGHDRPAPGGTFALERLRGTIVSAVAFDARGHLRVSGGDPAGRLGWTLTVRGSARFTFAHVSERGTWLVEANYDAGGTVRSSDREMMLAACGAVVDSVRVDEIGLFIRSDDGRAIEIVHAVDGEEDLVLEIMAGEEGAGPTLIALPGDLGRLGPGAE